MLTVYLQANFGSLGDLSQAGGQAALSGVVHAVNGEGLAGGKGLADDANTRIEQVVLGPG